ncbi:hypothetical protein D3C79_638470 [compost metagenome]
MQDRQNGLRLSQPFQYRMAQHQVVGFCQLPEQVLPGRLDERCRLPCLGKARAGAFKHRCGGLGEGDMVTALSQPQGHMTQARANIQNAQRAFGQGFGQVRLKHRKADCTFGTAVDFFGKACGQGVEMAVFHRANRRSLSASLARTTCSMSRPSSLHSNNR